MLRITLCVALARLPVSAGTREIDPALLPAVRMHRAGDLEGADRAYRVLPAKESRKCRGAFESGRRSSRNGKIRAGHRRVQDRPSERARKSWSCDFNLGLALYKIDHFVGSYQGIRRSHATCLPDNKQIMLLLGDCYLRQGMYPRVIELLDPTYDRIKSDMAVAYLLGLH